MKEITIKVNGMTCDGCVNSVRTAIEKVEGVKSAEVSLESKVARVGYDESRIHPAAIREAIADAGYEPV